jgi:hypothetical protein
VVAAVVQGYGLRDGLMEGGVGGAIAAMQLGPLGATWLPDVNYVLHGVPIQKLDIVSLVFRDNVMAVASSFSNDTNAFACRPSTPDLAAWQALWKRPHRRHVSTSSTSCETPS